MTSSLEAFATRRGLRLERISSAGCRFQGLGKGSTCHVNREVVDNIVCLQRSDVVDESLSKR